jgi:hypothetical protein
MELSIVYQLHCSGNGRLILFICIRLFNLRARTETRGNVSDHEWVRSFSRPFPSFVREFFQH